MLQPCRNLTLVGLYCIHSLMLTQGRVLNNPTFFLFCVIMFWPSFLLTQNMIMFYESKKIAKHIFMQNTLGIQNMISGTLGSKQPISPLLETRILSSITSI
ncbi:hypothetical protein AMTRI_Chr06g173400 [Amborella trichopoda]